MLYAPGTRITYVTVDLPDAIAEQKSPIGRKLCVKLGSDNPKALPFQVKGWRTRSLNRRTATLRFWLRSGVHRC
jgi:hypothetical protein